MKWIHLSDIHFGHHKDDPRIRVDQDITCKRIVRDSRDLASKIGPPDFILVTGDVAYKADEVNEYSKATEWLQELVDVTGANRDCVFFVPGNHDVDRNVFKTGERLNGAGRIQKSIRDEKDPDAYFGDESTRSSVWNKFEGYTKFVNKFGTSAIFEQEPYWRCQRDTDIGKVTFVGLNTCLLSYDKHDSRENLALGETQLKFLDECPEDDLLIVMQHHPPGWLIDSKTLEARLGRRPHILLCGHMHEEKGSVSRDLSGQELFIFSSGAAHMEPGETPEHKYSWWDLSKERLLFYPRVWSGDAFVQDGRRYQGLDENGGSHKEIAFLNDRLRSWLNPDEGAELEPPPEDPESGRGDKANNLELLLQSVSWMKEAVCYDQGEYFQFHFQASEIHKRIKDLILCDPYDFESIKLHLQELYRFLTEQTRDHYSQFFEFIFSYFEQTQPYRTSQVLPRICVKQNFDGQIVPFSRYGGGTKCDQIYTIEDNTGFSSVRNNGIYYLCQNIPRAALQGEYVNPRLIASEVAKLDAERVDDLSHDEWASCWVANEGQDISKQAIAGACYRSTLIVPMTLLNNKMHSDFLENFILDEASNNLIDRTIFGYLCFDHENRDYFLEGIDSQVGYIFADIMSRYLLTTFNFTSASSTYRELTQTLGDRGLL